MGVDAVNVADSDLGNSPDRLLGLGGQTPFPLLSANIAGSDGGRPPFQASVTIAAGNYTVGVVGLAGEGGRSWVTADGRQLRTTDPVAAARPLVERLAAEADLVVLLAHVEQRRIDALIAELPGVDIVLGADGFSSTPTERRVGDAAVAFGGRQGKQLGVIEVSLDEQHQIASLSHRLVTMSVDLPEAEEIVAIVGRANARMQADDDEAKADRLAAINADYVGYASCRGCHSEAHEVWRRSAHYDAFSPLISAQRVADGACLACHTTGYGDGGFIDLELTPRMVAVQCEACHGPGAAHTREPSAPGTLRPAGREACIRCHDAGNSPNFDFEAYWAPIAH